jgi:hypothetical protein
MAGRPQRLEGIEFIISRALLIIFEMSEPTAETVRFSRRRRLLWTLLGAMALVGLLPLVVSHYFLIQINRDSLETLEKKYLTRSAVGIATDIQNLLANNQQQLSKIAGSLLVMQKALPAGTDPFTYAGETQWIGAYMTQDSDLLALRLTTPQGVGAEAKPADLEAAVLEDMEAARQVALSGRASTGVMRNITGMNVPVVVLGVPVLDGDRVQGTVVGLISLKRIADRIREEGKGDVTAFVVDRNGRVLIHSEPAVDVQHPDFSKLKIVEEFSKASVRLTESYTDRTGGRSEKMLGTVAPVGRPEWGVVVQ